MAESPLIERALTHADLEIRAEGDGRTVYGLAVPFDRETTVDDGYGPYAEVFRQGAFARTINAGVQRVKLLGNHDRRKFPLGAASMLREDPAGLVGEFRISKTREGDDALELVRDGALDSFSVGFAPVKERKAARGLIERLEVKLREVSLVAFPAYEGAAVAGVRAQLSQHLSNEELERLLALARNLDTPQPELAESLGTSVEDPSAPQSDPVVGHSQRTPTRAQRTALALITGVIREPHRPSGTSD
jgi:HK97 family phage prohead protease